MGGLPLKPPLPFLCHCNDRRLANFTHSLKYFIFTCSSRHSSKYFCIIVYVYYIYYIYTSKYPATQWHLTYCKIRMQYHKLSCSVIIHYHWLRLHKFHSPALFICAFLITHLSFLQLVFLSHGVPFPLSISPASKFLSYFEKLLSSLSYLCLSLGN